MTSTNGTFKGDGEDMIAALIAASSAKPAVEVVSALPGERELVPFDFESGGSAEPSAGDATSVAKVALPTPNTTAKVPSPKQSAKAKAKKSLPTPRGSSSDLPNVDPRVRANKVCEPQKPKLTPEQQAAVLAASANAPKNASRDKSKVTTKVATVNERWANSSFQNAPAPDQLPMPGFLKDLPSQEPKRAAAAPAAAVSPPPMMMRQPASAEGLKNLLGVAGAAQPPAAPAPAPARTPSGHALFNNMMSSAIGGAPSPPPQSQYAAPMPPASHYAHPPPTPPVQNKLNALFGFPAQPFPVPPMYPTTPEGDFQKLMAKLNAGRA